MLRASLNDDNNNNVVWPPDTAILPLPGALPPDPGSVSKSVAFGIILSLYVLVSRHLFLSGDMGIGLSLCHPLPMKNTSSQTLQMFLISIILIRKFTGKIYISFFFSKEEKSCQWNLEDLFIPSVSRCYPIPMSSVINHRNINPPIPIGQQKAEESYRSIANSPLFQHNKPLFPKNLYCFLSQFNMVVLSNSCNGSSDVVMPLIILFYYLKVPS